jgi:hypothetical protein
MASPAQPLISKSRSYECHVPGLGWSAQTIDAQSAGKARYQMLLRLQDSWDVPITAIRVRVCERRLKPAEIAKLEADAFNARTPIGTLVRYWTGLKEGEPSGTGEIYHESTVVSQHAVAWIKGCRSCVSLSHVEVV